MDNRHILKFFLGSNSGEGFYSLYDDFTNAEDFLWIIKGGPGCGKSSFMKKIGSAALEAGLDVEYIFCSADPNTLDGVYIPQKRLGYVDGTAPHVIEAKCPAATGLYLDLGRFYGEGLREKTAELIELNRNYRELYDRAYEQLKGVSSILPGWPGVSDHSLKSAILHRAESSAQREFGRKTGGGKSARRFLSAITCNGYVHMSDTARELCDKIYAVDNENGFAPLYLSRISELSSERGVDKIDCFDPLRCDELQAVLLPGLRLGYIAHGGLCKWPGSASRHVRLDAMPGVEKQREIKQRLKAARRLREQLLDSAVGLLAEAKSVHDKIERIYNPHVDFDGLYALAKEHVSNYFG